MTISQGPRTFSMTVDPGLAVPASNASRLAPMAFSLSSRSLRLSVTVSRSRRARRRCGEAAAFVEHLSRRPLYLAARRPSHRSARHQYYVVHDQSADVDNTTANGVGQFASGHRAARFGDHDRSLGTGVSRRAECDDASASDARQVGHAPFQILWVVLGGGEDDKVL